MADEYNWFENKNVKEFSIETTMYPTDKSAYEVRYVFPNRDSRVNLYWRSINVGRGYSKRLVAVYRNGFRKVIARVWS